MKTVKMIIMTLIASTVLMGCNGQGIKEYDGKIIGTWTGSLIDSESGEKMSPMTMEFTEDGQLNYILDPGTEMQNGFSTAYRTKDNYLYTESLADDAKEEKAKYRIDGNRLIITTGKMDNEFVKQD